MIDQKEHDIYSLVNDYVRDAADPRNNKDNDSADNKDPDGKKSKKHRKKRSRSDNNQNQESGSSGFKKASGTKRKKRRIYLRSKSARNTNDAAGAGSGTGADGTSRSGKAHSKHYKKHARLRMILLLLLAICILGGLVVAGFVMVCISDAPEFDPDNLPLFSLTSYIYDRDGDLITPIHGVEDRTYVDYEDIPQIIIDTFIYTEDARFYDHHGVDLIRIAGALLANVQSGGISEGASTITMQVAQNLYLPEQKSIKSYKRKVQEAYLAIKLENNFSKEEILEMYLNIIYFGEGAYGIQSASNTYFGKDVSEITEWQQAALLAGLPNGPSIYDPFIDMEAAQDRYYLVLDVLVNNGILTQEEADKAKASDLGLSESGGEDEYIYPYFIEAVITDLVDIYGEDAVYKGGMKIYSTLDTNAQSVAEDIMSQDYYYPNTEYDENDLKQPEGAVVIMDPDTGYVRAIVGGREHTQLMQFNRATQAYRQPGSSFKPIGVYSPAVELLGWTDSAQLEDRPISYGNWSPENADGYYRGWVTMREALTQSVNTIAVQTLEHLITDMGCGVDQAWERVLQFAEDMGIKNLDPEHDAQFTYALGGLYNGVTPLEMASAYCVLANGGTYYEPTLVTKVESETLGINDSLVPESYRAISQETADTMTDMLRDVVLYGTGVKANLGIDMSGKTGTTDSGKDLWFCGYTSDLVGVVWIGYDIPQEMPNSYGADYPTVIWHDIMSYMVY